jgi:hypothetical protein
VGGCGASRRDRRRRYRLGLRAVLWSSDPDLFSVRYAVERPRPPASLVPPLPGHAARAVCGCDRPAVGAIARRVVDADGRTDTAAHDPARSRRLSVDRRSPRFCAACATCPPPVGTHAPVRVHPALGSG